MSVFYNRLVESVRPKSIQLHPAQLTSLPDHDLQDVTFNLVDVLKYSMEENGWQGEPIVTIGKSHQVLDGRHRTAAAKALGIYVEVINISEAVYATLAKSMPPKSLEEIANWARGYYS